MIKLGKPHSSVCVWGHVEKVSTWIAPIKISTMSKIIAMLTHQVQPTCCHLAVSCIFTVWSNENNGCHAAYEHTVLVANIFITQRWNISFWKIDYFCLLATGRGEKKYSPIANQTCIVFDLSSLRQTIFLGPNFGTWKQEHTDIIKSSSVYISNIHIWITPCAHRCYYRIFAPEHYMIHLSMLCMSLSFASSSLTVCRFCSSWWACCALFGCCCCWSIHFTTCIFFSAPLHYTILFNFPIELFKISNQHKKVINFLLALHVQWILLFLHRYIYVWTYSQRW